MNYEGYAIPGIIKERNCLEAAVLVPVVEHSGSEYLLFEVRSSRVEKQPGDICFPGGRIEYGENPQQAAVRECCEELCTDKRQITVNRPENVLVRHGIIIYPFLGKIEGYTGTFNEEVLEVFEVPLDFFKETQPQRFKSEWKVCLSEDFPFCSINGGRAYLWPTQTEEHLFYEYNGRTIWGYTAKIVYSIFGKRSDLESIYTCV